MPFVARAFLHVMKECGDAECVGWASAILGQWIKPGHVFDFMPHCRIVRNFDKRFSRIEAMVNHDANSMKIVHKFLMAAGATKKPGVAPAGDLERKLQAKLDAVTLH